MRKSFNLFPFLLCLFYTTAQAGPPLQNDFDFLEPLNDTALVANGLELTGSIAGFSLSTLLNLGIWWGVCKTAGIVSGLSSKYDLAESDTKELEKLKTDFCLQLAPVMTTTEVALAGHVSPWPLEQRWWKPLYFAGAGMAAYAAIAETKEMIPVAVLIYLASGAVSSTGAGAISALTLRKMSVRNISIERYAALEYTLLSVANGAVAGTVAYEAMIYKGLSPAKATLASVVSAAIAGTFSGIVSVLTVDVGGQTRAVAVAVAGAVAITVTGAGAIIGASYGLGAIAGAIAGTGAIVIVGAGALAGAMTGAGASVLDGAEAGANVLDGVGAASLAGAGASVLGGVGASLTLHSSKITSNNLFIKAGVTLVPALTFAVINSLSNYAVYGYPLEEGFSETGWTQWKKFYAPLDYLSTLFN
ncbi:hypothetical protein [Endozoicomonas sp. 8E]|uniref:hypothetical protein n=1 Tax=Endozoicomonas sp. 8E TaxID=3035692 RepID=UPI0029394B06|nr:hypothetical protein [Endozoicomonas sp. 8E]WOG27377.1 hypothetical protein P6910_22965 [Endozoicomonas sp. 8E]